MSEPHFTLPKVAIQFDGERFLCYPNRSLKWMRDEFNFDIIEEFRKGDLLDVIPKAILCGLHWAYPEMTLEYVDNWFLDNGGPMQDKEWALAITEALTGKRPKDEPANPPPAGGAES